MDPVNKKRIISSLKIIFVVLAINILFLLIVIMGTFSSTSSRTAYRQHVAIKISDYLMKHKDLNISLFDINENGKDYKGGDAKLVIDKNLLIYLSQGEDHKWGTPKDITFIFEIPDRCWETENGCLPTFEESFTEELESSILTMLLGKCKK